VTLVTLVTMGAATRDGLRLEEEEAVSDVGDQAAKQASDQARFAAREFLVKWKRETGEILSETSADRMTFSYEMGYLRGRSDGTRAAMDTFDDVVRAREHEARKARDDTSDPESE